MKSWISAYGDDYALSSSWDCANDCWAYLVFHSPFPPHEQWHTGGHTPWWCAVLWQLLHHPTAATESPHCLKHTFWYMNGGEGEREITCDVLLLITVNYTCCILLHECLQIFEINNWPAGIRLKLKQSATDMSRLDGLNDSTLIQQQLNNKINTFCFPWC